MGVLEVFPIYYNLMDCLIDLMYKLRETDEKL